MKQHQTQSASDKLNIGSIVIAFIPAFMNIALLLVTARYMLLKQHVSVTDGQYFTDNGIWARLLRLASGVFGMSQPEYCHIVFPVLFIFCFIIIYSLLGIRLFSADDRGTVYSMMMTMIFISLMLIIFHVGYFSPDSPEAGVYLNPWQGNVIAGILLTPILVWITARITGKTVSWKQRLGLIVTAALFLITAGIDNWKKLIVNKSGFIFLEKGWLLMLAAAGLITICMMKKKGAVPVIAASLIAAVFLVPAPVGMIAAYAVTEVIGEGFHRVKEGGEKDERSSKKKTISAYITAGVIYCLMVGVILAAGFFSGSRVSWNASFGPIENKERLPQDLMDMNDWIMTESDPEIPIYTSTEAESVLKQLGCQGKAAPKKVQGLWAESPMKGHDIRTSFEHENIPQGRIYVIIKNVTDEDVKLMSQNGLWIVKSSGSYNLYGR